MGLLDDFRGILSNYTPNLLPDDPDKNAAARQGLLAAGAAMMSTKGENFAGSLGKGLLAGGETYQSALTQQQQDRLRKAQQQRWDLENEENAAALASKRDEDAIIARFGAPGSISAAAGIGPTANGVQPPAGAVSGTSGAQAGGAGAASNGAPYSDTDAGAAARALMNAGVTNFSPEQGNQVMALVRQGMSADQAAQAVIGGGAALSQASSSTTSSYGLPGFAPAFDSSIDGAPGAPSGAATLPSTFRPGRPASPAYPSLEGLPKKGEAPPPDLALAAYNRALQIGNDLLSSGHETRAKVYFAQAETLKPKLKEIRDFTTTDGRNVVANVFEGGRIEPIEGYAPKPAKLEYHNIGNETVGLDPAGNVVVRLKNGVSPGTRSNGGGGGGGGDSPIPFNAGAIKAAAARYNLDGTLPPMGMGKIGVQVRAAILNEAANQNAGVDPTQQRKDQLAAKGDAAARNAAVKSFSTGKDGQAVQSANTALNHLDTIRQLAEAQKSGDVRVFNQAARSLGAAFGRSAPTDLNAALVMVAPEISKAVVGAGGTGHERDQALQALNPNGSPEQILGATKTMQELFGGRLTEAKRTYERTTKLNDFDTTMLSPAARTVLARAQQHGAGASSSIPAGAVKMLKADPTLRQHFDNKYGAGAAASILGK